MEGKKQNKTRKTPCPRGSRWNKKEQRCIENKKTTPPLPSIPKEQNVKPPSPSPIGEKTVRKRCPRGSHWNKSQKKCIKIGEKEKQPEPEEKQPEPEANQPEPEAKQPEPEVAAPNIFSTIFMNENIPLGNKKKCPTNYVQHPPKSKICVPKSTLNKNPKPIKITEEKAKEIELHAEIEPPIISLSLKKKEEPEEQSQNEEPEISLVEEPEEQKENQEGIETSYEHEEQEPDLQTPENPENNSLFEQERKEHEEYKTNTIIEYEFLYPSQNDPHFNIRITSRKEFNDIRYDGEIHNVEEQADKECKSDFELLPHQLFVKNFLSLQTPYNSLLLYAALGTGKTCSAIGVTEEMRAYMKQTGIQKQICVVASPNVQSNFRLQLFNPALLKEIEPGIWNLDSCVGNSLLKEINPTMHMGLSRDKIIKQINSLINHYYIFIGYGSLANYIEKTAKLNEIEEDNDSPSETTKQREIHLLKNAFDNRLFVIDEVHNIIASDDNELKRTSTMLMRMVKYCEGLRFLFLSATPMYNSHLEIIWLTNLMQINDKRATIDAKQVFNADGTFVEEKRDDQGIVIKENGRELLKRKLIGYVSFVRGENPYLFPFRVYPQMFASPEHLMSNKTYPAKQINGKEINNPLKHIPVYVTELGEYQKKGYTEVIKEIVRKGMEKFSSFENMESFGYALLQTPISALNIIYPNKDFDMAVSESTGSEDTGSIIGGADNSSNKEEEEEKRTTEKETKKSQPKDIIPEYVLSKLHGKTGLQSIMESVTQETPPLTYNFRYRDSVMTNYGRIFQKENLSKYSAKIASICESISKSTGIVLIYSKYIEGGLIPIALALEEMGLLRTGAASYTKPLFSQDPSEKPPAPLLDPLTMQPKTKTSKYTAKYVMITGQKHYSPNNEADLALVTDKENKDGKMVKVVLISEAGSEGLDFKNIRQVHVLDPWYNMNRIEQIIGRAVRNKSHCGLPFKERNVEIYMHATYLSAEEETMDLYLYRLAERKALQIGQVTRLLKETAVDCLLNIGQTNFTEAKMGQTIKINLSTERKEIDYVVGDKPYSNICDYMETCEFSCSPKSDTPLDKIQLEKATYDSTSLQYNHGRISKRIRQLFRDRVFYTHDSLLKSIQITRPYPLEQIFYSLSEFLRNKKEWLVDSNGRKGHLISRGNTYAFQPYEISDERASIFERSFPVDYKPKSMEIVLPSEDYPRVPMRKIGAVVTNKNNSTVVVPEIVGEDTIPQHKAVVEEGDKNNTYAELLLDLQKKLEKIAEVKEYVSVSDKDWYNNTQMAITVLTNVYGVPRETCFDYVIEHYLDTLKHKQRLVLLQGTDFSSSEGGIKQKIRDYFIRRMYQTSTVKMVLLCKEDQHNNELAENVLYKYNQTTNSWREAATSDLDNAAINEWRTSVFNKEKQILEKVNAESKMVLTSPDPNKYPFIPADKQESNFGFINMDTKNQYKFRIKNVLQTRNNLGANCDESGKIILIGKINHYLKSIGNRPETEFLTKEPNFNGRDIQLIPLCIIFEMLMRYYSSTTSKTYFMNSEESTETHIRKVIVIPETINGMRQYVYQQKPQKKK